MTTDQTDKPRAGNWRIHAAAWGLCIGLILALLGWSLHRRISPWELEITIPSGFDEADYRGVGTQMRSGADLSRDGRLLAIARADGRCDIWDINQSKRIAVLGEVVNVTHESHPGLYGALEVHWTADGRAVVIRGEFGCAEIKMDGSRVELDVPRYGRAFAVSPVAPLLATSDLDEVRVIDLESGRAPNVYRVIPTTDGKRLIEVGIEKTVRIWRQRREPSTMGAFALSETWAIYILSIGLLAGIVLIGVKDATREFGQRIPQSLWTAAILACVCLGLIIGNRIVSASVGRLYDVGFRAGPQFNWIDWTILSCLIAGIVGLMRLSRGWWIFMHTALLLAALLIAGLGARIAWELHSATGTPETVRETLHGVPIRLTPALELSFLLLGLMLLLAEIFLLSRGEVRALYQRSRFLDPSEPSSGFPLAVL